MDRRNFLVNGSRWLLASGLVGVAGLFWFRRQIGDPRDCFVNPYCKKCAQNGSCGVLALTKTKTNVKEGRK